MVRWVVGSILHGVDPLSYFSFQPVLHYWCNKGRGMCYPVCGMMHIKEPLLLIGKSSPCGGSGFPLSLSEWSFTICPSPYNRKLNELSASLNKTLLPSFLMFRNRFGYCGIKFKFQVVPIDLNGQNGNFLVKISVRSQYVVLNSSFF